MPKNEHDCHMINYAFAVFIYDEQWTHIHIYLGRETETAKNAHREKSVFCRLLLLAQRFFIVALSLVVLLDVILHFHRPQTLVLISTQFFFSFSFSLLILTMLLLLPKKKKYHIDNANQEVGLEMTVWWKIKRCVHFLQLRYVLAVYSNGIRFCYANSQPLQFRSQCKSNTHTHTVTYIHAV